ncbi:MAG TPA: ATP-binding protein [Aggregatilineales bacterium]|nr:ATP-binding protein [Aggregatilineales bacterium]
MTRFWVRLSVIVSFVVLASLLLFLVLIRLFEFGAPIRLEQSQPFTDQGAEHLSHFLLIGAVCAFSGVGVGVIASRQISRPITELVKAVRRVGAGELGYQVTLRSHALEFDLLSEAINRMSLDLQHGEVLRRNLMADVSHELRTPLTILEGHLRAALDHVYALDESEIATLYSQTHHLIRLVDDLNLLAQAEGRQLPLECIPTDITHTVTEIIENFTLAAEEKGIALRLDIQDNIPLVKVDVVRVRQVLTNLLDNALRFTQSGGQITLHLEHMIDCLTISVADTGDGLPAKEIAHVFDRFYRTDSSRSRSSGGSGLGLAIAKALIEIQGGTIAVSSEGEQRGATFTISIASSSQVRETVECSTR